MKLPALHRYATRPGVFLTDDGGADAVVWSDTAEGLWLSVIEEVGQPSVFADISLEYGEDVDSEAFFDAARRNPVVSRTIHDVHETLFQMQGPNYGKWMVHIPRVWEGMRYGYRADGPWRPQEGLQFNPRKFLIDPCAKGLEGGTHYGPELFAGLATTHHDGSVTSNPYSARSELDSIGYVPYSVFLTSHGTNSEDETREPTLDHPHIPWARTIIYELHVKGFTAQAPWLPQHLRGTYAGLAHPQTIAYLKGLGITSVELLPILASQTEPGIAARGMHNYWGYSPLNFFSPNPAYATKEHQRLGAKAVRQEVIDMVRALHQAGLEVILDVVYNHSCEGSQDGYSLSWRGLNGFSYYRRNPDVPSQLIDTTGTGNTFNFLNTEVINLAVDSLRYWAKTIGVDGFRFDLAVSLARLEYDFTPHHPFLYAIRADKLLGNLKLIMEPWDTGGGGWRTGKFNMPFSEWNDHFRDSTRRFWLTDQARLRNDWPAEIGMQEIATRLCGSSDLFASEPGRGAAASVNFLTAHDGFTLADLTRYDHKHNEANGENNMDGASANFSDNFGVEGTTQDSQIGLLRQRAALGMIGQLLMSLGTPMLQAGDEFGRTQQGNNNAYCQDSPVSWLDWSWLTLGTEAWQTQRFRATRKLLHLRQRLDQFHHHAFFTKTTKLGLLSPSQWVDWYIANGEHPSDSDWFNTQQRSFVMRLRSDNLSDVLVVINGDQITRDFLLPHDCGWELLWTSQNIHLTPAEGSQERVDEPTSRPYPTGGDALPSQTSLDAFHFDKESATAEEEMFLVSTTIRAAQEVDEQEHQLDVANPGEHVAIPGFTISLWLQR